MHERNTLVDRAAAAITRGSYRDALEAYRELERIEPDEGVWSRRAGEMLWHLGETGAAVDAFAGAVDKYARAGFLVKAIAVCKLILRIKPHHAAITDRLEELTRARGGGRAASPGSPAVLPLEQTRLRDAVPGATERGELTLIPIDTSDFDTLGAALAATPLFSGLAAVDLGTLVERVELRELAAGEILFRQGDRGDRLYVIAEGRVRVVTGEGVELATLGEGDFFGEIALVSDVPRSATVEALEPTQLLGLGREAVSALLEARPAVLSLVLGFLRDRLLDRLIKAHPLLSSFTIAERAAIARRFELVEIDPGTRLIGEGERSPGLYVILAGTASVDRGDLHLASLEIGAVFGEISLLTGQPAIASVTTTSKVFAVMLEAAAFRELIMTHPQVLIYVNELAESRHRRLGGEADYDKWQLELF